jgi:hypothetical protein
MSTDELAGRHAKHTAELTSLTVSFLNQNHNTPSSLDTTLSILNFKPTFAKKSTRPAPGFLC